ncbi:Site-specific DNA recombinase [Ectopseudomonas composti]|uniref:Site-specific DNA recombinase n=1 Tax=Ectopseudomonas composti TaxID=658457 RepID=A0A1I5RL91_9GAMM|nr:recombinase family protein [Pseudomonas composti]SFP59312.1 Site-specific DNA recombinase [Pseudomonas composti]
MTTYIYSRVSSDDQNVQQQSDFLAAKHSYDFIVSEKFTGTTLDRPQFDQLIKRLKIGDTLIVREVSRLGRNAAEVLTLCEDLKARGVKLIIDNLSMDVTSPSGQLVLTLMVGVAQMERESMLERQRIGINRAKAEGKYQGRKALDPAIIEAAKQMLSAGASKAATARHFKIGQSTLYSYLKDEGL